MFGFLTLPAAAHALNACTAAQVNSQDPGCPSGSGACNITKAFDVGDGCTLDFGTRAVTITASGKIDIFSNTVTILAGSFTVAPSGRVEGRGTLATPPRDRGGSLTITTTGAFNVQRGPTLKGVIDLSGNVRGGTFIANAGGAITVSGDLIANNLTPSGGNGNITLRSAGDITTGNLADIAVTGGDLSSGGFIDIDSKGKVDLGTNLIANGGDGGVIDVQSVGESIVRGMNATGGGDAGSGGCASVFAGTRVQMLGPVVLNGTGSPTNSGGGCGGFIDIDARYGDVIINSPITADSGAPDGGGGGIGIVARGSISHAAVAPLSVQGQGPQSCGGEISLESDVDITSNGTMDASGGFGGNLVDVLAGRSIILNARVDAQGRDAGGFGGAITVIGGERDQGDVAVNASLNVDGGGCGTLNGCGLGGFNEISGCNVTVASGVAVSARGPDGGDNLLTAREKLTMQGTVDATTTTGPPGVNGTNTFQHPTRVAPTIVVANVHPTATVHSLDTCTAPPPPGTICLKPCPTCGNGMVEFPETCDTAGTPVNCDGCSSTCKVENCNDSNACTNDSCDPSLGCRNAPVADGSSCTDFNVCNGVESCLQGLCRTNGSLNCNDGNVCTTDSCNPALGCQNPAAPVTTPCNDGNICTSGDHCDGAKVCVGGAPACGTTTSTTVPTPTTTSTSAPLPTTTTTSLPPPSTTTTTVPAPTTSSSTSSTTSTSSSSSTSSPTPTTTSTSVPGGTTSSTSLPTPTTSSTSVPAPTTSSTSVPGATSTSTTVAGPSTTSTTTATPTTTSTSLPTGCVPADCADGNACTTDVCQAGSCIHRHEGFTSVECEIGKLETGAASLCTPDPIYAKLVTSITLKSTKAHKLVTKAKSNPKTAQALLNRAAKQLTGLRNRITKAGDKGKITPACRAKLDTLVGDRLVLVQGLGTP